MKKAPAVASAYVINLSVLQSFPVILSFLLPKFWLFLPVCTDNKMMADKAPNNETISFPTANPNRTS